MYCGNISLCKLISLPLIIKIFIELHQTLAMFTPLSHIITTTHRGILGNILFSFALTGSCLLLLLLGNLLHYFTSSTSLIFLFLVTFIRSGFLIYSLSYPIKKRLPRLGSVALTLSGLIAFNYAFPIVCEAAMYVILTVFLDQWSRSEEEEEYIANYFLDGYDQTPGGSSWMLPFPMTLGYILFHELFTFGLCFPFTSGVSAYTTPFHSVLDGYETVLASPRPGGTPAATSVNQQTFRLTNRGNRIHAIPVELERELTQKVAHNDSDSIYTQHGHVVVATAPPSPPQNPMWVVSPTAQVAPRAEQQQQQTETNPVKAYPGSSSGV